MSQKLFVTLGRLKNEEAKITANNLKLTTKSNINKFL